jgi:hypothetical protein
MKDLPLPDAVQMPVGRALRLHAWGIATLVVAMLCRLAPPGPMGVPVFLKLPMVLAPLVPLAIYARALVRWTRGLDELQRQIQIGAWLFAAVGAVVILTIGGILQANALVSTGGFGWESAVAIVLILQMGSSVVIGRRYR